ncbi:hypothetical protein [Streptomyces sp. NPDC053069]|uniref:hypothetical protein n=1 Tax=Streptomyces sp. NPDC053069 TaxID=3365695 RepID=UPI0037D57FEA
MRIKHALAVTAAVGAVLGSTVAAAPAAPAAPAANFTPDGCGDTSNGGQLCIRGGHVGTAGTYKFTVSYWNSAHPEDPEITVGLGMEHYNEWTSKSVGVEFGHKKTQNGYAKLSKGVHIQAPECVRGVMTYKGKFYITKWVCP